jgi:hypothetical protein
LPRESLPIQFSFHQSDTPFVSLLSIISGGGVQGICQADSGGRIADSGQAAKKKRGAWQNHTRLSHNAINSYYTSLDHLLLGKAADNPIIKPLDPNNQWAFFGCGGT